MIALYVFVGILVVLAAIGFGLYSGLASLRRQTQLAFGQIDLQLKRRCDAIPPLAEHVKEVLRNDQPTIEKLLKARSEALSATSVKGKAAAESHLHQAIDGLFAIAHVHPELELDDELLTIQETFRTTQSKIAFAAQYYNDVAKTFNERLEAFPWSFIAAMREIKPIDLFGYESAPLRAPTRVNTTV